MRQLTLLMSAALLALAVANRAEACTCTPAGPACQAFWSVDAVFDATVTGISTTSREAILEGTRTYTQRENVVTLDVRQAFKGVAAGALEVVTAADGAACGFTFKPGTRYLIFAHKRVADGKWTVSACSATQEYDGTGEAAAFFASLARPAAGARIFGQLRAYERRFDGQPPIDRRVETTVRLFGAGDPRVARSSPQGTFEFTGLPAGPYRVEVEVPKAFSIYSDSQHIEIPDPRACARADFYFSSSGSITGIVMRNGRPAPRVKVEVIPPGARDRGYGFDSATAITAADGSFEVRGLPPGQYILGVNLEDLPSQYNPFARTVFPSDGTGDGVIQLQTAEIHDIGIWQLPPPLTVFKLSATVLWEDGSPAAGTYLGLWDVTGNPAGSARGAGSALVRADGTVELDVREGRTYSFVARDNRNAFLSVAGPQLEVGSKPPAAVRIVVRRR